MSDIICITNRKLCTDDFLRRIEKISLLSPAAIILREKDMSENEYQKLATNVLQICKKSNTPCILHSFINVAKNLGEKSIHLPMHILRNLSENDKNFFNVIGSSCHCVEEAMEAESLGCSYITAGHIFQTDCKKNLPPRGIDFLKDVCKNVNIPVLAIGGMNEENAFLAKNAGADGVCVMSRFMTMNI